MLDVFDRHYAPAAGVSWILSYGVVYAFNMDVRGYGKKGEGKNMARSALWVAKRCFAKSGNMLSLSSV